MALLPKVPRLTGNRDFRRVYRAGRSYSNRCVVLYVLPRRTAGRRVGFSVSKKIGGAVVRNRVKRRLREISRVLQHGLQGDCDMVLLARRAAATAEFAVLRRAVIDVWQRAGVWHPQPEDGE